MSKFGEPELSVASLPEDFSQCFAHNGIWRVRRGLLSASFFRGVTRLMNVRFGQAELSSVKISADYFRHCLRLVHRRCTRRARRHRRLFAPRDSDARADLGTNCRLVNRCRRSSFEAMIPVRALRRVPPLTSTLTVRQVEQGFDLCYKTLDGLDRVVSQIAFDFPRAASGKPKTRASSRKPGKSSFSNAVRRDALWRRCNPNRAGHDAHRMWQIRDAEPAPQHVRALMTFVTPIEHAFSIRVSMGDRLCGIIFHARRDTNFCTSLHGLCHLCGQKSLFRIMSNNDITD